MSLTNTANNTLYLKVWLIKNIRLVPKDIAEMIKWFLFYDSDKSQHRELTRAITATINDPGIFVRRRCFNTWHYDEQLQIFVNASNTWIIYVYTPGVKKICDVDMCATMCDYCGEYMESETVEKEDIPLCIQCKCLV
jgi:hypothetical protein